MPRADVAEDSKQKPALGRRVRDVISLSVLVLGGMANMLWIALLGWLFCGLIYGAVIDYL